MLLGHAVSGGRYRRGRKHHDRDQGHPPHGSPAHLAPEWDASASALCLWWADAP